MVLAVACRAGALTEDDERAQDLFQQHRWFALRGVPVADRYAAALTKGALASAFNRSAEAERELKLAIHLAKGTEQLHAAREKLVVLYLREARTRDAVLQMRAMLKRDPARADVQSMANLFGPLATYPNTSVHIPKGGTAVPCEVLNNGVWLSLTVNGKAVTWLLDTGFNFSGVSESEARALGVAMHDGGASIHDFAGGEARTKSGVAEKMTIGGIVFRNVPLLIFPDSQPPWLDWSAGRRGVIGLPVAVAMQTLSWTREGACTAGRTTGGGAAPNLAFDDFNPVVQAVLGGQPLELVVDTGNQAGTQLWSRFKADFPALLSAADVTSSTAHVRQVGGGNDRHTTEIPELKFDVGTFTAMLKPARVFDKPVGNDYQHGLLGMDVFCQAHAVFIDFRSMTVTIR